MDDTAHARVIRPRGFAIYVQPKCGIGTWLHHVTVAADEHCVDAMTGADGHAIDSYLATYFHHPEAHFSAPVEDGEWNEL